MKLLILICLVVSVNVILWGAGIYIVIHFASKFW